VFSLFVVEQAGLATAVLELAAEQGHGGVSKGMESLFWHLANRTAETEFIFSLFHLLLAGLTLLCFLHQLRGSQEPSRQHPEWLLSLGFFLLGLHFLASTVYFGTEFFFRKELEWATFERLGHGLLACGLLVVAVAYVKEWGRDASVSERWLVRGIVLVASIVLVDFMASFILVPRESLVHSVPMFVTDVLTLGALGFVLRAGLKDRERGNWPALVGFTCAALVLALHGTLFFLPGHSGVLVWNFEKHLLSVSLFAFAWAAGERSQNLLGRVFVRLNLTFIILASLIMLITVGMEKYQYLRLAEDRSMNLAEFLRGHITYYRSRGDSLEEIIRNPAVLKRVVVEFGTLPELRTVNVYLDGRRASFHYGTDWEVKEEIVALGDSEAIDVDELENGFQMLTLPLEGTAGPIGQIEFLGTTDYINEQIGNYIILIYILFTVMVGLATGLIGMIVADTDRRLRRQYNELQETHQQLAQVAKLASVGQLAGGMAHEINNPSTSILSLGTHMTDENNSAGLNPRQRKNLQLITEQAQRIYKIVGSLLTFSRQGRMELSQVDVEEVLDSALTLQSCHWYWATLAASPKSSSI
jgi:signal transduction histidine kinase